MTRFYHALSLLLFGILLIACTPTQLAAITATPTATYQMRPTFTTEPSATLVPPTTSPASSPDSAQTPTPTLGAPECPPPSEDAPAVSLPPANAEGFPSEVLLDNFHAYLNAGGDAQSLQALIPTFEFIFHDETYSSDGLLVETDVTGDAVAEIVVGLMLSTKNWDYSDGFLKVYSCSEGAYQEIRSTFIGSPLYAEVDGLRAVMDMNGDDLPEIVTSWIDNFGAHGHFTRLFFIDTWNGETFVPLVEHRNFYDATMTASYATVYNGDGEILDVNEDGIYELVLNNGIAGYYGGPQRKRKDIFSWDGHMFTLSRWEYEAPTYRFQAVRDGDDATLFGDFDRALAAYQQAIFDEELFGWRSGYFLDLVAPTPPVPDPDERPRLEAYSRYRILLLHAARGYINEVQIVYETLQEKFASHEVGGPYAELAANFWETFQQNGDMAQSCEAAVAYANTQEFELLGYLRSAYGDESFEYDLEDLCPFPLALD
jgi:hypothetical protein